MLKRKYLDINFIIALVLVLLPTRVCAVEFPTTEEAYSYVCSQMEEGEETISFSISKEIREKLDFFNNSVYVSTLNWGNINYIQLIKQVYNPSTNTTDIEVKVAYKQNKAQLQEMRSLARTWVNENIDQSMGDYEKVKKIYDYLGSTTKYENTGKKEYNSYSVYSPMCLLKEKVGVCNAYSGLFKILAEESGLDVVEVFGKNKANGVAHVWNMVKIDGTWYHIDLTQANKEVAKAQEKRFTYMTSSADMEKYYSFNKTTAPQANNKYFA